MGYGAQTDYVSRYSGNSYDTIAYKYGYYSGYISSSMSFSSIVYPIQLIYNPYFTTSCSLYYATFSSYSSTSYYDSIVDKTFSYATSISTLYPTSSPTLSGGAIAGIVIGSVLRFFILACIVLFATLYRHPRVNINVNETAVPASTKNDGFSKISPSPGVPPNHPYGTQVSMYTSMQPKFSWP